jgi:hypothetical protein
MATYAPPSETLTIFNPDVFLTNDAGDFLAFPVAQGSETFPFGLTASSLTTVDPTTIDSLVMSDLNPQYKIDYPVDSGRIDFYSNTSGGVSTRGGKIDATGVHTISKFDTIDETAGVLNIGTATARTGSINIGTGSSSKTITIGVTGGGNTAISGSNVLLRPTASGNINIGDSGTSGNINIGRTDSTSSSQAINIGTGSAHTGAIEIGTADSNKNITIGSVGSTGSSTLIRGKTVSVNANITSGTLNFGQAMTDATATINIGTESTSQTPINIGTGTGTRTITIGNTTGTTVALAGSTITASKMAIAGTLSAGASTLSSVLSNAYNGATATGTMELGTNITTGNIRIGSTIMTGGSILIGYDSAIGANNQTVTICSSGAGTGELKLGYGGSRTIRLGTTTSTINIGETNSSCTINLGMPLTPAYTPASISAFDIGTIQTPTSTSLTTITTSAGNLAQFDLGVGVWDVQVRVRMTNFVSFAKNFFRLSLSTTSGTQSTYVNDWMADNADGAINLLVNGKFSLSATTTIYVVGSCGGGIGTAPATATTNADVQAMRVA